MKMIDKIQTYLQAKDKLTEYLDFYPLYAFEFLTDKWFYSDGSLSWPKESLYSVDAFLVQEFEDCSIFKVNSRTGDVFYLVLLNSEKDESIYDYE